jgi:hypothetical protein
MSQRWWLDPESAWWAKADCAKRHIDTLAGQARDLLQEGSFRLTAEQQSPGVTAYRLKMSQPVPISFSTTLGDALHDLRSALDCAACAIARRHVDRDLCEDEERDCEFPICKKRSDLTKWFKQRLRPTLFGQREQQAIRRVQPAAMHDELAAQGQTALHPRADEVEYDNLYVLQRLSNVDKHRRLHVVTCWPDLVYWGSDEPSKRQWRWGKPPFVDGVILGYLIDDPQHPEPLPDLQRDIQLRLTGPRGAAETDVARLLEGIHQYVTGWVLPRVLNP